MHASMTAHVLLDAPPPTWEIERFLAVLFQNPLDPFFESNRQKGLVCRNPVQPWSDQKPLDAWRNLLNATPAERFAILQDTLFLQNDDLRMSVLPSPNAVPGSWVVVWQDTPKGDVPVLSPPLRVRSTLGNELHIKWTGTGWSWRKHPGLGEPEPEKHDAVEAALDVTRNGLPLWKNHQTDWDTTFSFAPVLDREAQKTFKALKRMAADSLMLMTGSEELQIQLHFCFPNSLTPTRIKVILWARNATTTPQGLGSQGYAAIVHAFVTLGCQTLGAETFWSLFFREERVLLKPTQNLRQMNGHAKAILWRDSLPFRTLFDAHFSSPSTQQDTA